MNQNDYLIVYNVSPFTQRSEMPTIGNNDQLVIKVTLLLQKK